MRRTMWQLGEKLSQFGEYKLRKRLKFWRIQTEKEIENEELIWKPGPREIWRIQTKIESICRIKTEKEIENRKNLYGNLRYREFAILQLYSVRNLTQTHKSRLEFQTGLRLENISFCTITIQFFSEISVTSVWALFCL